ncbi:MAG: hypothetical protein CHKLHMKO_00129 [Candidatus Argoarchaeum ethanivorans]|uniref:Uncharacterized protein n=1 Tax=Candidatus Argoarchaeum ethanivorans TaxID=2608793 RepID=A0A811TA49_9EURY|nr:MAG: hypothetical protein CHKLHMKO_00129 [Candidatus Argoarchaeum ethanivorans]
MIGEFLVGIENGTAVNNTLSIDDIILSLVIVVFFIVFFLIIIYMHREGDGKGWVQEKKKATTKQQGGFLEKILKIVKKLKEPRNSEFGGASEHYGYERNLGIPNLQEIQETSIKIGRLEKELELKSEELKEAKVNVNTYHNHAIKYYKELKILKTNSVKRSEYDKIKEEIGRANEEITHIKERCGVLPNEIIKKYILNGSDEGLNDEVKDLKKTFKSEEKEWQKMGYTNDTWILNTLFSDIRDIMYKDDITIFYQFEYIFKLLKLSSVLRQNQTFTMLLSNMEKKKRGRW